MPPHSVYPLLLQAAAALPTPHAGSGSSEWWAETKEGVKVLVPFLLFFIGRRLGKGDKARERRENEEADLSSTVKELKRRADENDNKHINFQQSIESVGNSARNAETLAQQNKANIEALHGTLGRTEGQLSNLISTLLQRP